MMTSSTDMFKAAYIDGAMDTLKMNVMLEENTFYLKDGLPTEKDTDSFGRIMCFHKDIGWRIFPLESALLAIDHGYIAWTYTPPIPPPLEESS